MNGCIYRTEYGECGIPNRSEEYGPLCRSDCTDKHPSNADRIRSMTDKELAEWLNSNHRLCPPHLIHGGCTYDKGCGNCWIDWLQQEAE